MINKIFYTKIIHFFNKYIYIYIYIMFNKLLELKSKYNYFPTNIIDIGVHKGTWIQQMLMESLIFVYVVIL